MPLPFIVAGFVAATSTVVPAIVASVVGAAVVATATGIVVSKIRAANRYTPADFTILIVGEQAAGKDAVINLIESGEFKADHVATPNYYTIECELKGKKIKIINTSGSEDTWANTEEAVNEYHDLRCYVFDSTKFGDKYIRRGIISAIEECEDKKIKLITIGTRGDSMENKNISNSDMENNVRKMGVKCKIFELSKKPREELIEYIFKNIE